MKNMMRLNAVRVWRAVQPRIALICLQVFGLVWWLRLFESQVLSILITVSAGGVAVSEFRSKPRRWRARGELAWLFAITTAASALVVGDRYDLGILAFNGAVVVSALPLWWLTWQIMRRRWLLFAGMALALGLMMLYWAVGLYQTGASLQLLLLPLPAIFLVSAAWATAGWIILYLAEQRKNRRVAGPGMQAAAMAYLFLPSAVVAVVIPRILDLGEAWSAVSLTLVGVLLSAVVADPLRRFLVEWGNLAPGSKRTPQTSIAFLRFRSRGRPNVRFRRLLREMIPVGAVLIVGVSVMIALVVVESRRSATDGVLGFVLEESGGVVITDFEQLARAHVSTPQAEYSLGDFFGSPQQYGAIAVAASQVAATAVAYGHSGEPELEILKGHFSFDAIREELDDGLGCIVDPYRGHEFWACPAPQRPAVALFPRKGYVILASRLDKDLKDVLTYRDDDPTKLATTDDGRLKRILDWLPDGFLSGVYTPGSCEAIEGCEGFGFTVRDDGGTLVVSYVLTFESTDTAESAQDRDAPAALLQRVVAEVALELHPSRTERDGRFIVGTAAAEFSEGAQLPDGLNGAFGVPSTPVTP